MYFLNPRLAADIFDDEYIIPNLDTGLYYSVTGVAAYLLSALPFPVLKKVIKLLTQAFPENSGVIKLKLISIVKELLKEEIMKKLLQLNVPKAFRQLNICLLALTALMISKTLLMLDPIHDVDEEGWTVQNNDYKK